MRELFHNIARIENTDAGVRPLRFSPGQLAHYAAIGEAAAARSLCTAGVTMEFVTDASQIAFTYAASDFSRPYVGFDIVENGRLCAHIAEPDHSPGGRVTYTRREKGPSTIQIHLSNLNCIHIRDLELGDWQPVPAPARRILFLGDSITQGMTTRRPSMTYPALVARHFGAESLNMGVGGMRFDPAHLDAMPEIEPWRIVVAYGINDIYRLEHDAELDEKLQDAKDFLQKLRSLYPSTPVDVLTPVWNTKLTEDEDFARRFPVYSAALAALAGQYRCHAVDGLALVPHDPRYFADGTHPNGEGFAQYALGLLDRMQRV